MKNFLFPKRDRKKNYPFFPSLFNSPLSILIEKNLEFNVATFQLISSNLYYHTILNNLILIKYWTILSPFHISLDYNILKELLTNENNSVIKYLLYKKLFSFSQEELFSMILRWGNLSLIKYFEFKGKNLFFGNEKAF